MEAAQDDVVDERGGRAGVATSSQYIPPSSAGTGGGTCPNVGKVLI
jgi:hypothetical protein